MKSKHEKEQKPSCCAKCGSLTLVPVSTCPECPPEPKKKRGAAKLAIGITLDWGKVDWPGSANED